MWQILFGWFYLGKMWKNMEKQQFFLANLHQALIHILDIHKKKALPTTD